MSRYEYGASDRSPHQVAVYLDQLRQIGQIYLPALATDYAKLNTMAAKSEGLASEGFVWAPGRSNATYELSAMWQRISNALQNAFGDAATNLDAVAGTIVHVEHAYAGTDATNAGQIDAVRADNERSDTSKGYHDPHKHPYKPVHVTMARPR